MCSLWWTQASGTKMIVVDTKNILFICGGAFDGIEKKIAQRLNTHVVGYVSSKESAHIDRNDFLKYITTDRLEVVRIDSRDHRTFANPHLFEST